MHLVFYMTDSFTLKEVKMSMEADASIALDEFKGKPFHTFGDGDRKTLY